MVTLNLRDDCNGRVATNFKRGMTDKRFLELEITAWLTSPERKKQLEGEAYYDGYDGMEKACRRKGKRTTVYYCHPHAPHERGSNENMNRIIRRFFPKGTNFDEVPISEIRRAEEWMNNYPREVLGWQTAATLLRSYMSAC